MSLDPTQLWAVVDKGGLIALSLLLLFAFIQGWIVPKWAYLALKEHCGQITALSDRNAELAKRMFEASVVARQRREQEDE